MTPLRTVAALAASALLLSPFAALAGKQDFTLVNKTGYEIGEVYVSPAKSSDWESDVLGRDVLPDGDRVDISFSRGEDTCFWDLKVVYTVDGSSAEWDRFNLCEVSTIRIFYNAKNDTTSAETE